MLFVFIFVLLHPYLFWTTQRRFSGIKMLMSACTGDGFTFSADDNNFDNNVWSAGVCSVPIMRWIYYFQNNGRRMSVQFYQCLCRQTDGGMDFSWISWLVMEKAQRGAVCTFTSQQYVSQRCDTHFFLLVIQKYTNSMMFIQNIAYFFNTPHLKVTCFQILINFDIFEVLQK